MGSTSRNSVTDVLRRSPDRSDTEAEDHDGAAASKQPIGGLVSRHASAVELSALSKLRRGTMRKHLQLAAIAVCIVLSGSGRSATPLVADAYRLGVDDKLRIRVYEWRNSVGEVHERKALVDEFTVGPPYSGA